MDRRSKSPTNSRNKNKLVVSGHDLDYYYYEAISHSKAYLPYTENDENQIIWMLDSKKNGYLYRVVHRLLRHY